ncbi:MAG: hypothetical protein IKS98_08645 [Lachnospiraceae bacterium]|nr:hypothetical protein [Lachnospiraceae bacterium]
MKRVAKILMLMVVMLLVIGAVKESNVQAANGKTVRVSTAKAIKKAINNPDVGTIIFRTEAYINVTIKANKSAAEKFLIIDADNANVVNKAVFAGIEIQSAKKYTESVSGNNITISGYIENTVDGFVVSKKKKVNSLTIDNDNIINDYTGFLLRKGAKIKEVTIKAKTDGAPCEISLSASKKEATLKTTDYYGDRQDFKIKIDKNGRIVKKASDSDDKAYVYEYNYKYDSNGNLIKVSGSNADNADFTITCTYDGTKRVKREFSGDAYNKSEYKYDKNGYLVREDYNYEKQTAGGLLTAYYTTVYEHDINGRRIYYRCDYGEEESFIEKSYTYDKNGFLLDEYMNDSGYEVRYKYKYNKAGDKILKVYTEDGETDTITFKYDELGNEL